MSDDDHFARAAAIEASLNSEREAVEEARGFARRIPLTFPGEISKFIDTAYARLRSANPPTEVAESVPGEEVEKRTLFGSRWKTIPPVSITGWPIYAIDPGKDEIVASLLSASIWSHGDSRSINGHQCLFIATSGQSYIAAYFDKFVLYAPAKLNLSRDQTALIGKDARTLTRGEAFAVSGMKWTESAPSYGAFAEPWEREAAIESQAITSNHNATYNAGSFLTLWAVGVQRIIEGRGSYVRPNRKMP